MTLTPEMVLRIDGILAAANLFLPPVTYPDALAFMRSLHIRHKFEAIGHPEYLEHMARAVAGMSRLAFRYSPIAEKPRFIFTAFEVNPFVIAKDDRFVALDGLAEFRAASEADLWAPGPNRANLEAFFRRDRDGLARLLLDLAARHDKPMVVSVNAGRYYADFVSLLEEGGLPVYADIRSAISSLDTFVSYRLGRKAPA
jgi:hypothetical protein